MNYVLIPLPTTLKRFARSGQTFYESRGFHAAVDKVQAKAANVCYRCGWAKIMNLPEDQQSQLYDLVSLSNLEVLHKNPRNKPYKIIYKEGDQIKVSDLKNTRQLDLIQLM